MCKNLFVKRDSFQVLVVRILYLDTNILSRVFHITLEAEILSSARTTIDTIIFSRNSKILINHMMKQRDKINRLKINK